MSRRQGSKTKDGEPKLREPDLSFYSGPMFEYLQSSWVHAQVRPQPVAMNDAEGHSEQINWDKNEPESASIYVIKFAMGGKVVVTGADDG
jgi:hypothetical protein